MNHAHLAATSISSTALECCMSHLQTSRPFTLYLTVFNSLKSAGPLLLLILAILYPCFPPLSSSPLATVAIKLLPVSRLHFPEIERAYKEIYLMLCVMHMENFSKQKLLSLFDYVTLLFLLLNFLPSFLPSVTN